jgi:hypothetical protein
MSCNSQYRCSGNACDAFSPSAVQQRLVSIEQRRHQRRQLDDALARLGGPEAHSERHAAGCPGRLR